MTASNPIGTAAQPAPEAAYSPAPATPRPSVWLATASLWRREMVRFVRQKNRVFSAMATPILFWVLLGSGLNRSFAPEAAEPVAGSGNAQSALLNSSGQAATKAGERASYLEYFFPGTVVFILLSTAIFSTISVIEDRREGFLQGVLASPAPRVTIVLGKVLGGATIATVQGVLFLTLWPLVAHWPPPGGLTVALEGMAAATAVMFILAVGLTALGLCIAWPMDSTAGFHAVMMVFLMPMWFLSGAVFPLSAGTPLWLKMVMYVNPLTYGQVAFSSLLRRGSAGSTGLGAISPAVAMAVTAAFTVAAVAMAVRLVSRPRKDGLA